MKRSVRLAGSVSLLILAAPIAAAASAPAPAPAAEMTLEQFKASLSPQTGVIRISEAKASLDIGQRYFFLGPVDARKVLVDAWGNPPEAAEGVLGMIFPAGADFASSWGAVVTYEETGHISDKDAASEDYAAVLKDMQEATEASNEERAAAGYPRLHLAGWAQAPTYDGQRKVLVWARDLVADGDKEHSLNYDVRSLGRTGVLSLNMVDGLGNLAGVRAAAGNLGQTVRFDAGARYADFNPDTDEEAGYGLAGLVAAGAGLGAAKKLGLLGILAAFGKKAFVFIALAVAGVGGWLKRRFSRAQPAEEGEESA